jgi:hypothetical protein
MTVLMASIVDVTIILAIGLTLAAALRRRSAAVRHAVLTTSIVCAALAPALELVLPQLPVIRGFGSGVEQSSEIRFGGESPVIVAEAAAAEASSWPAVSWPVVVVGAWVVATVITFAGLALSLWRLRRRQEAREIAAEYGPAVAGDVRHVPATDHPAGRRR